MFCVFACKSDLTSTGLYNSAASLECLWVDFLWASVAP